MPERRKIKRRYLMYYSRVFDARNGALIGHLVDITPEGIMLISETPLAADQMFRFKMELSEDIADKSYLTFTAKSIWCQPDVDPRFFNTGFHLLDITPQDTAIIQHIIEAYGFRDN